MYQNLGIHWASSIPAFLALACVPFPFLFYKYGKGIRLRCKYAAEAAKVLEQFRSGGQQNREEDSEEGLELGDDTEGKSKPNTEMGAEKDLEKELESRKSVGQK